jgi:ribosomal protein L11 methyltransferase
MPQWIEVSMRVDGEAAEAIAQELQRWCHQGVAIEQAGIEQDMFDESDLPPAETLLIRGYFPNDAEAEEKRLQIQRSLGYMNMMLPMPRPEFKIVADEDWADAWKKHYKPVRLGKHILVRPLWIEEEAQPDDIVIALDPGMAFGTGTHPTTQLCLEAIERMVSPALDVLDLGCGSGILSIAAAKLGLETVITSARRFDLIVVNILARSIIAMCDEKLGQIVRPGGRAIFSGIIENQAEDVEAALRKTGLEPVARFQQGDWVLIEAKRPA